MEAFEFKSNLMRIWYVFFRLERSLTQSLRQQQDEAYEVSLRADQEKERLKQLEREKIIQQQLDEEAERNAEVQRKEVSRLM